MLLSLILLASIWGCGATRSREGTGEYVDDSVITTKVKAAIFNDSTLKVNEIHVETFQGMAQLSGLVRSQADIDQAVKVVRGVADVKSVKNDMRITGGVGLELLTPHDCRCWAAAQTDSLAINTGEEADEHSRSICWGKDSERGLADVHHGGSILERKGRALCGLPLGHPPSGRGGPVG